MKTSQSGVDLIKSFEGYRNTAYMDSAGIWTVGYGHTGPDVTAGTKLEHGGAEVVLRKDLAGAEKAVTELVKVPLNQNQFDALVSFVFNLGSGAFAESTLLKRLNAKESPCVVAKEELPRWNKAGGKVLSGLTRRRQMEAELFCSAPPVQKIGTFNITSKVRTWLKKLPIPSSSLASDQKAMIGQGRTLKNCEILKRGDNHTLLKIGFGLGEWWIFDPHWDGLETKPEIKPYAVDGNLRYLRDFPYFLQRDNGPEGWRQCQTSCIAMCLKYLDVPGVNDDKDYLKIVNKYGDTTHREPHKLALKELKAGATFITSGDEHIVKSQIDKGLPVVAGVVHHGPVTRPSGSGHFVVITGYDSDSWLVQDPYGELDLVNGGWANLGSVSGRNVHYSFKNFNPRFFYGGGASGWCWINFRRVPDGN